MRSRVDSAPLVFHMRLAVFFWCAAELLRRFSGSLSKFLPCFFPSSSIIVADLDLHPVTILGSSCTFLGKRYVCVCCCFIVGRNMPNPRTSVTEIEREQKEKENARWHHNTPHARFLLRVAVLPNGPKSINHSDRCRTWMRTFSSPHLSLYIEEEEDEAGSLPILRLRRSGSFKKRAVTYKRCRTLVAQPHAIRLPACWLHLVVVASSVFVLFFPVIFPFAGSRAPNRICAVSHFDLIHSVVVVVIGCKLALPLSLSCCCDRCTPTPAKTPPAATATGTRERSALRLQAQVTTNQQL